MNTLKLLVTTLACAAFTVLAGQQTLSQTQPSDDYFIGEWNAVLIGLPDGDLPFIINITIQEDSLQAKFYDEAQTYVVPVEKIARTGENALSLSFYDYNNGVDVIINLIKKDEDNLTGNVLNMYTITATRKK